MQRAAGMAGILVLSNVAIWALTVIVFASKPVLLGTALLAYVFGLRHAVDADHIAAIDATTRTLMRKGGRPLAVGLFFSLGHSTVVLVLCALVAFGASFASERVLALAHAGGTIGSTISASFLLVIAAVNAGFVAKIVARLRRPNPGPYELAATADDAGAGGMMSQLLRPLLRVANSSAQMYPIGVLFGLGFDTATEIALLGISAIEGARGLSVIVILLFPLLFAAGMSLVDTADGMFMVGAYRWALARPRGTQYYNLTMTLISASVALVIGGVEAFGVLRGVFAWHGGFWDRMSSLNADFGWTGLAIVALFALAWGASVFFSRARRIEEPEPSAAVR